MLGKRRKKQKQGKGIHTGRTGIKELKSLRIIVNNLAEAHTISCGGQIIFRQMSARFVTGQFIRGRECLELWDKRHMAGPLRFSFELQWPNAGGGI